MEAIVRNVRDIEVDERRALESVVGRKLDDNQQVVIQIVSPPPAAVHTPSDNLPAWCNVYDGLTEQEVADVEKIMLERADLTRAD